MLYLEKPSDFKDPQEIVGCFVECKGKILLLHRQDHKQHGNSYGPPGGKVDPEDASLDDAMRREIFEETGLRIAEGKLQFIIDFYVRYPERDFIYHQYRTVFDEFPKVTVHDKEHKGYVWVTPEEALTMSLIHDEDECIKYVYKR